MPNIFPPPPSHDCKINTRDCGLSQSFTSALCVVEHILLWSVLRRTGRNIAPLTVTGSTLSSFKYKNSTCPSHPGGGRAPFETGTPATCSQERLFISALRGHFAFLNHQHPDTLTLLWCTPHPVCRSAGTKLLTMRDRRGLPTTA